MNLSKVYLFMNVLTDGPFHTIHFTYNEKDYSVWLEWEERNWKLTDVAIYNPDREELTEHGFDLEELKKNLFEILSERGVKINDR
jgi:hypothetical protein